MSASGKFIYVVVKADDVDLCRIAEQELFTSQLALGVSDLASLEPCDKGFIPYRKIQCEDPAIQARLISLMNDPLLKQYFAIVDGDFDEHEEIIEKREAEQKEKKGRKSKAGKKPKPGKKIDSDDDEQPAVQPKRSTIGMGSKGKMAKSKEAEEDEPKKRESEASKKDGEEDKEKPKKEEEEADDKTASKSKEEKESEHSEKEQSDREEDEEAGKAKGKRKKGASKKELKSTGGKKASKKRGAKKSTKEEAAPAAEEMAFEDAEGGSEESIDDSDLEKGVKGFDDKDGLKGPKRVTLEEAPTDLKERTGAEATDIMLDFSIEGKVSESQWLAYENYLHKVKAGFKTVKRYGRLRPQQKGVLLS